MKKLVFLVLICTILSSVYSQDKGLSTKELLDKFAKLKPFSEKIKDKKVKSKATYIEPEALKHYIDILPKEDLNKIFKSFVRGVQIINPYNVLAITQWKDSVSAQEFKKLEVKFLKLRDKQKKIIKTVEYKKEGNLLISYKKVLYNDKLYILNIFVALNKNFVLEGSFVGKKQRTIEEIKEIVKKAWDAILK